MAAPAFSWDFRHLYRSGATPWPAGYPDDTATYFSPVDGPGIHKLLVDIVNTAQQSLVLNMYGYDDNDVDTALFARADEPNMFFQMSLDSSQAGGVHEKQLLAHWYQSALGSSIAVGRSVKHAISHLKVLIVDSLWVISGSTNWSMSGEEQQDNQLTVTQSPVLAAQYRTVLDFNHLEMLKQQARIAAGLHPQPDSTSAGAPLVPPAPSGNAG
jgi:phosphatidylserine/phosphatidylglycerophosphate/cardiolipin synthase-like enzyme